MYLCANLDPSGRVLSVSDYQDKPDNCPIVIDFPRNSKGDPDDPRRYKWDSSNNAYVFVPEWSVEVDEELARASEQQKTQDKYKSFLSIIALISIITIIFEIVLYAISDSNTRNDRAICAIPSMVILFAIIVTSLFISNDKIDVIKAFDDFVAKVNRGKAVTYIFFAFLASNALFIIQDGGATHSAITEMLLINTSFGFFLARKGVIKFLVVFSCALAYFVCSFYYFSLIDKKFMFHELGEFVPHLVMFVIAALISTIINWQYLRKHD